MLIYPLSFTPLTRETVFLDAPVSIPIVSSHRWNSEGFRSTLEADWGETVKKENGETDPLIMRNGAYVMNMRIDGSFLMQPDAPTPPPAPTGHRPPKGFQQAGAP